MSGYRRAYTYDEEAVIIKYIIDTQSYTMLKGKTFWKELEMKEGIDRTWQSLRDHFLKKMVLEIQKGAYNLTDDQRRSIQRGLTSKHLQELLEL